MSDQPPVPTSPKSDPPGPTSPSLDPSGDPQRDLEQDLEDDMDELLGAEAGNPPPPDSSPMYEQDEQEQDTDTLDKYQPDPDRSKRFKDDNLIDMDVESNRGGSTRSTSFSSQEAAPRTLEFVPPAGLAMFPQSALANHVRCSKHALSVS
jgi:hypothetical protein